MANPCVEAIHKSLGETNLKEGDIVDFIQEVNDFAGENASPSQYVEAAKNIAEKKKVEAVMRTRLKIIDSIRTKKNIGFMHSFKSPIQAIQALLTGHSSVYRGSMKSVDNLQKYNFVRTVNRIVQQLEDNELLGDFAAKEMDLQIAKEMWALSDGKGIDNPSGSARAKQIAEILHSAQRATVERANRAGAWIRDIPGYIVRQSHDPLKIKHAGYADWYGYIKPRLDLQKTLQGIPAERHEAFFKSVFAALETNLHFQPLEYSALKGKDNLGAMLSKERTLHFKSADDWHQYHEKFGIGGLNDAVFKGLKHLVDNTMMLEVFGSNPSKMLERLKDEALKTARDTIADVDSTPEQIKGAERDIRALQSRMLDNMLQVVSGRSAIPANPTFAAVSSGARTIVSMSSLGKMVLSSISDMGLQGMEARYQGENLFTAAFKPVLNLIKGRGSKERQAIGRELGVYAEGVLGQLYNRHYVDDGIPGFLSRSMRTYFKLNANNWWNDAHRTGFSLAMSHRVAEAMTGQMHPEMRRVLKLYDIGPKEIKFYKTLVKDFNGKKILTADSVDNLTDAQIKEYLGNPDAVGALISKTRDDLRDRLGVMYVSRTDHAHITPGAKEVAILTQGAQAGSIEGEILRHFTHFKSFPTTMITKIWTRETMGRVDAGARYFGAEGIKEGLIHGNGSITGLLGVMMLTTMYGYLSVLSKDLIAGREPRDPFSADVWKDSMMQGGSLGIFGDYIFGEYNRYGRSALSSIVGPTFGQTDSLFEIWNRFKNGDPVAAQIFKQIQINTPYQNLFYLEAMLDYLFFYQIQESLSPGFLSRMESRMETDRNQRFIKPPTTVIPYGGNL